MSTGIRIRALRLRGLTRDYGVAFDRDGTLLPLGVIAGEISTGKSSVLEFIDYCLGAASHPMHEEIRRAGVRTALLEVLVSGEPRVIERPVFARSGTAILHDTDIAGLGEAHERFERPIRPPGDPQSLSWYLLDRIGLAGIGLKEAPTQAASGVDPMSFRDLSWLCYVPNERLGSRSMFHETEPMKALKLRQVIEAVFGVHEQALVELGAALQAKERHLAAAVTRAETLKQFLAGHDVPARSELEERVTADEAAAAEANSQLDELDAQLRAASSFGDELRARHAAAAQRSRDAAARLRDRQTLLRRLLPLRGQYVADIARLHFFDQTRSVFDPLAVTVCPACRTPLSAPPSRTDGHCSLCGQEIATAAEESIDVSREIAATEARLKELDRYISEVEGDIAEAQTSLDAAAIDEKRAQAALDEAVNSTVSPYVVQRDQLVRRREELLASIHVSTRWRDLRAGASQANTDAVELAREADELRGRIKQLEAGRPTRTQLVTSLSGRFAEVLDAFGFPKLHDALLDDQYIPHVRGLHYAQLSSGARTLVGIAWHMAVLELAIEQDQPHPGFLMFDGIQKNLRPVGVEPVDPDFAKPEIVTQVYNHLAEWTSRVGSSGQVIVVDNAPPERGREHIVVEYSADPKRPPYGLIDDAID